MSNIFKGEDTENYEKIDWYLLSFSSCFKKPIITFYLKTRPGISLDEALSGKARKDRLLKQLTAFNE